MVKHTQTIRQQKLTNYLTVFGHFVGFSLEGLRKWIFLELLKERRIEHLLIVKQIAVKKMLI